MSWFQRTPFVERDASFVFRILLWLDRVVCLEDFRLTTRQQELCGLRQIFDHMEAIGNLHGLFGVPRRVLSAEIWQEGRGVNTVLDYGEGRRAVATWIDLPDLWDFKETLEVYGSSERVLVSFPTGFARGLPSFVTVHGMDADPYFVDEGDIDAARALVAEAEDAELFLYPGDQHYFADSTLPSYDKEAAALLTERVLNFLRDQ